MNKKAFTLVELLVVISVVGVLSTVVIGNVSRSISVAKDTALLNKLKSLQAGLELYHIDHGEYPPGTYNSVFESQLTDLETLADLDSKSLWPCSTVGYDCPRRFFYRSLRTGTQGSRNLTAAQSACWANHYYIYVYLDNPITKPQAIQDFPCGGAGSYGDSDGSDFCPMFYPQEIFPDLYQQCMDDSARQGRENYVYVVN